MLLELVKSLRPRQWVKNLFIFIPLVFSQNLLQGQPFLKTLAGFGLFCLASGCAYVLNDLIDLERDRVHPRKSKRPLASGRLPVSAAVALLGVLLAATLFVSSWLGPVFFALVAGYLALQVGYSLLLKRMVILDMLIVAAGFVIRVIAGAVVIAVPVSPWLLVTTMLLALFLVLGKRRHELILLNHNAGEHREILEEYNPYLIDQMIAVVTASILVTYSLYTLWPETVAKFGPHSLAYTIPFVLYGLFRYLFLIHRRELGGHPEEVLFTDKPLLLSVMLWAIAVVALVYW